VTRCSTAITPGSASGRCGAAGRRTGCCAVACRARRNATNILNLRS